MQGFGYGVKILFQFFCFGVGDFQGYEYFFFVEFQEFRSGGSSSYGFQDWGGMLVFIF